MTDENWHMIEGLIQDLSLVKKGLASSGFSGTLSFKLEEMCDNNSTVNELQELIRYL